MISLGVDIGGTGAKCVAFRDDGEQLALSYVEYPNPPGKVNLEAEVLSASVVQVIRECVDALELICDKQMWPYPSTGKLIFSVK